MTKSSDAVVIDVAKFARDPAELIVGRFAIEFAEHTRTEFHKADFRNRRAAERILRKRGSDL